jgi:aspartate kinase
MVVMKFGGTSVADAAAIRRVTGIVARERQRSTDRRRDASAAGGIPDAQAGPVVVVSALAGVTDRLLEIAALAQTGQQDAAGPPIDALRARHQEAADLVRDPERRAALRQAIDADCDVIRGLVGACAVLHEVTPRSSDALVAIGELLSSRIVTAAFQDAGLPAAWIDARQALVTTDDYGAAAPLLDRTAGAVRATIERELAAGRLPVVGGFVGATLDGVTTTLGRGGSDYSASLFGACLRADEIQIWTDVDGMLTADPRVVPDAHLVPRLSFAEASELAYFGAKVLHPSTIQPAVDLDIPVRILNSRRPEAPGTTITAHPPPRAEPLTALACTRDVTVIDITSTRMLMAHGFLRRLFEVFERFRTPVDVVTTSEVSVSVTINDRRRLEPLLAALSQFAEVSCEQEMALVCAVGENLRSDATLFARVLGALEGVSLRMVSQAASRRNVTFVIRQADLATTMTRLHERFFATAAPAHEELKIG